MIEISPAIGYVATAEGRPLTTIRLVWQGVHVCVEARDPLTGQEYLCDLPVNQAVTTPFVLEKSTGKLIGGEAGISHAWFTDILKNMAYRPNPDAVPFTVERRFEARNVLILNTLDYLYGHTLLFFLNLQKLLDSSPSDLGVVVLIQPHLRWLVPEGVAEIWTAHLPLAALREYYPSLSGQLNEQLGRFEKVYLVPAIAQPQGIDIERFTKIPPHRFDTISPRVTFIWRQDPDRLWVRNWYVYGVFRVLGLPRMLLPVQYLRVLLFFWRLRRKCPSHSLRFTLAGLGRWGQFPGFIEDRRVPEFTDETERAVCRVYSESRLVLGLHGSGMILPSALAGMTISLMPHRRWGNFAEDLLFCETDVRVAAFQKRILPLRIGLGELTDIASHMITARERFLSRFTQPDPMP